MLCFVLLVTLTTAMFAAGPGPETYEQLATGDRRPEDLLPREPARLRLERIQMPNMPPPLNKPAQKRRRSSLEFQISHRRTTPGYVTLLYDPKSGDVTVNSHNPDGDPFSCIGLESAANQFRFQNATWFPPRFPQVVRADKVFAFAAGDKRFASLPEGDVRDGFYMGNILPAGLTAEALQQDLLTHGAYQPRGGLDRYCPRVSGWPCCA